MSDDANALIIQDVQTKIGIADVKVSLEHISKVMREITFEENKSSLPLTANTKLDQLGNLLQRYSNLNLFISVSLRSSENNTLIKSRSQAIASYLESKWQIKQNRLTSEQLSNILILNSVDLQRNGGVVLQLTN
jgi:outer membrane protein OmpA-like peptidoglycan-associated protein